MLNVFEGFLTHGILNIKYIGQYEEKLLVICFILSYTYYNLPTRKRCMKKYDEHTASPGDQLK